MNEVATAVRDGGGNVVGFTKIGRNLTERRELEASRARVPLQCRHMSMGARNLQRHFKGLLQRAGLPLSFRFQDLRHTCATLLLRQGVHVKYVQELLGHADIPLTRLDGTQPVTAGLLSEATNGKLEKAPRYRKLVRPLGYGYEMHGAFSTGTQLWGGLALWREKGRPDFAAREVAFVRRIAPHMAAGLRAATLQRDLPSPLHIRIYRERPSQEHFRERGDQGPQGPRQAALPRYHLPIVLLACHTP